MFIELSREEAQLLSQVIHAQLSHCEDNVSDPRDRKELENLRHKLERLEHRLHEAEWDVTC